MSTNVDSRIASEWLCHCRLAAVLSQRGHHKDAENMQREALEELKKDRLSERNNPGFRQFLFFFSNAQRREFRFKSSGSR